MIQLLQVIIRPDVRNNRELKQQAFLNHERLFLSIEFFIQNKGNEQLQIPRASSSF